jgi:hypothetical protein
MTFAALATLALASVLVGLSSAAKPTATPSPTPVLSHARCLPLGSPCRRFGKSCCGVHSACAEVALGSVTVGRCTRTIPACVPNHHRCTSYRQTCCHSTHVCTSVAARGWQRARCLPKSPRQTPSRIPTPSQAPSNRPSDSPSKSPVPSQTPSMPPTPSRSPVPSASKSPIPSASPSPSSSVQPSASPSPSSSVQPSTSPSPSSSVQPSTSPSPSSSVQPSTSPSPSSSVQPSASSSPSAVPISTPSASPTPSYVPHRKGCAAEPNVPRAIGNINFVMNSDPASNPNQGKAILTLSQDACGNSDLTASSLAYSDAKALSDSFCANIRQIVPGLVQCGISSIETGSIVITLSFTAGQPITQAQVDAITAFIRTGIAAGVFPPELIFVVPVLPLAPSTPSPSPSASPSPTQ